MNPNEAREAAKILEAYAQGQAIQFHSRRASSVEWVDQSSCGVLAFDFDHFEYRIKPAPEALIITVQGNLMDALYHGDASAKANKDRSTSFIGATYSTIESARFHLNDWKTGTPSRVFKVLEVLPE